MSPAGIHARRLPRYDGCSGECEGQIARDQGVVVWRGGTGLVDREHRAALTVLERTATRAEASWKQIMFPLGAAPGRVSDCLCLAQCSSSDTPSQIRQGIGPGPLFLRSEVEGVAQAVAEEVSDRPARVSARAGKRHPEASRITFLPLAINVAPRGYVGRHAHATESPGRLGSTGRAKMKVPWTRSGPTQLAGLAEGDGGHDGLAPHPAAIASMARRGPGACGTVSFSISGRVLASDRPCCNRTASSVRVLRLAAQRSARLVVRLPPRPPNCVGPLSSRQKIRLRRARREADLAFSAWRAALRALVGT